MTTPHTRTAPLLCRASNRQWGGGYCGRQWPAAHRRSGARTTLRVYLPHTLRPIGVVRASGHEWPARPWQARALGGGTSYHRTLRLALRALVAAAPCATCTALGPLGPCPACGRPTPAQVAHRRAVAAVPYLGHDMPATLCLATSMTAGWPCPACLRSPAWHEHVATALRLRTLHHELPVGLGRALAQHHLAAAGL